MFSSNIQNHLSNRTSIKEECDYCVCVIYKERDMGEGEGTLQSICKSVHGQTEIIELTLSFHFRSRNYFLSPLVPFKDHFYQTRWSQSQFHTDKKVRFN